MDDKTEEKIEDKVVSVSIKTSTLQTVLDMLDKQIGDHQFVIDEAQKHIDSETIIVNDLKDQKASFAPKE